MVTTAEPRTTINNIEYICSAVMPLAYNSEPPLFTCCSEMRQLLINEEVTLIEMHYPCIFYGPTRANCWIVPKEKSLLSR
jgi:hypothetical protein